MPKIPFQKPEVEAVFEGYDPATRTALLKLRQRIFDVAAQNKTIGALQETLKWGQPSYLTPESKSGTTLRIDRLKSDPGAVGMFVNCQTTLAATYRDLYASVLTIDGARCVKIELAKPIPWDQLDHCIELALTYHVNKRKDGLPF